MGALLAQILAFVAAAAPKIIGTVSLVDGAISTVKEVVAVAKTVKDEVVDIAPAIKNIVGLFRSSSDQLTPEQDADLTTLDKQADEMFEAAAAKALAEDAAAGDDSQS